MNATTESIHAAGADQAAPTPIAFEVSPGPVGERAHWRRRLEERAARWFATTRLPVLARQRDEAGRALRQVPVRLQRLTNQTSLVLELVDDFRTDRYREVSWLSVAIATGAVLYCVSPADAIPDFIPLVGVMDEAVVLAFATRAIRRDLIRYADFKGYDRADYFA